MFKIISFPGKIYNFPGSAEKEWFKVVSNLIYEIKVVHSCSFHLIMSIGKTSHLLRFCLTTLFNKRLPLKSEVNSKPVVVTRSHMILSLSAVCMYLL